jgi:hypothetical protein
MAGSIRRQVRTVVAIDIFILLSFLGKSNTIDIDVHPQGISCISVIGSNVTHLWAIRENQPCQSVDVGPREEARSILLRLLV